MAPPLEHHVFCSDQPPLSEEKSSLPTNLTMEIMGILFANPILTASGTFGYGEEFSAFGDISQIGGIITKGISLKPRPGNIPPRICETAAGMLNSIGLENVGVDAFRREKMPFLRNCGTRVLVNFFGETPEEYVRCASLLSSEKGIDALEMNISCPNVQAGGIEFGVNPDVAGKLVETVLQNCDLPLIVKLTPNVTDMVPIAKACVQAGCSALTVINTLKGMAIDARTRKAKLHTMYGGLSGPAIKPVALRWVHQIHRAKLGVPIIASGGVCSGEDVAEFLLAGASMVQVGTANFVKPDASITIVHELNEFCQFQRVKQVKELVGGLRTSQIDQCKPETL